MFRKLNIYRRKVLKLYKLSSASFSKLPLKEKPLKREPFSSLYISGRYGDKLFPTVIPHFELNHYAVHFKNICEKWKLRDSSFNIDESIHSNIVELINLNAKLSALAEQRRNLEDGKEKEEVMNDPVIGALRRKAALTMEKKFDLEEIVMPIILKIPNDLHEKTTLEEQTLFVFGNKQNFHKPKSHIELGISNNVLQLSNTSPNGFYFIGPLSLLELSLVDFFTKKLSGAGFQLLSLPNLVKSAIVEACGNNPFNANASIRIKERNSKFGNALHLVGSSSVESFASYLTRMKLNSEELPVVFFNAGRKYSLANFSNSTTLFSPFQSTELGIFAVDFSESASLETFDKLQTSISKMYQALSVPFRIKQSSATNLSSIESLKVCFELWSPAENSYIETGHVSLYGEYLSKRLMMTHEKGYLSQCGGCVVNIPSLIACIMENNQNSDGTFTIPSVK